MNIDLSRKRHYTFEQAANLLQCSVEDLRYFVVEGELSPSLYLSGRQLPKYLMFPGEHYETDGHVEPDELTSTDELNYGVPQTSYPLGFFHLVHGRQTSAFERQFQFVATKPSGFDIGDLVFKLESPIGLEEVFATCVVMATELDRFKASHSFPQTSRTEVVVETALANNPIALQQEDQATTIEPQPPAPESIVRNDSQPATPTNLPVENTIVNRQPTTGSTTNVEPSEAAPEPCLASQTAPHPPAPETAVPPENELDPTDLPEELDAANMAFRAVLNGYGDGAATRRNRIVSYLKEYHKDFKVDAIQRIATVANPDKSPGRKTFPEQ